MGDLDVEFVGQICLVKLRFDDARHVNFWC